MAGKQMASRLKALEQRLQPEQSPRIEIIVLLGEQPAELRDEKVIEIGKPEILNRTPTDGPHPIIIDR